MLNAVIKSIKSRIFLLISSFILLMGAQPDMSMLFCMLASAIGFALFWKGMLLFVTKKKRFFCAFLWFGTIQAFHLGWFASDRYVGEAIYLFLFLTSAIFGLFFAFLSLLIPKIEDLNFTKVLQLGAFWTLFEWSRLFFLSGFSFNPVGLSLTASLLSLQFVSIFGIFGLSFWVIITNLSALVLFIKPFKFKYLSIFLTFALFPYLFGIIAFGIHRNKLEKNESPPLSVVLVQTALYPEEKVVFKGFEEKALHPLAQWEKIFNLIKEYQDQKLDFIIFSEAVVPYGTNRPVYRLEDVKELIGQVFHVEIDESIPQLSNAFLAQFLANHFKAHVVIGLEDGDINKVYNAAFLFSPFSTDKKRYEKRVLVPLGEYIPFSFCKKFLLKYGIVDSLHPGKEAKVFATDKANVGVSICYEETFGHLMRENRKLGANLYVNLTNDVWYPHSRLPMVHFLHGRVRTVESGVPLVRSCNTGITCGIDSLGRMLGMLPFEDKNHESSAGCLHLQVPSYHYQTLYTYLGDSSIIVLCCFFFFLPFITHLTQKDSRRGFKREGQDAIKSTTAT